jgi:hypothetical protein
MPKDKDYDDVDKHYQKSMTAAEAGRYIANPESLPTVPRKPKKKKPKAKAKAKKGGIKEKLKSFAKKAVSPKTYTDPSGYKALNKYMLEQHRQAELKKKIKKKKAEGAALRAKKRK